jgi:hypothetical protein
MEEGLGIERVTVWAKADGISENMKRAIEKMEMKRSFFKPASRKDRPQYTISFIKLQEKWKTLRNTSLSCGVGDFSRLKSPS